ncbi:MAG: 5'-methylthioadenosine/S-adenosylhomocysteine nucleosidase [Bifidobacteriaceae bacterium]|jgi:adenosylhomocysteine nucleosidase|nr:5'-methylthioadenosine/S-adenosylhomocysteine nucleosidase [Bifidobacteriaceae bacterium]
MKQQRRIKNVGILGALEKEIAHIRTQLSHVHENNAGTVIIGDYYGIQVVATVSGMGTINAASAAQVLISEHKVDAIIMCGIAGNLNYSLGVGDIVIAKLATLMDSDNAIIAESAPHLTEFASDVTLMQYAKTAAEHYAKNVVCGHIVTGNKYIDSALKPAVLEKYPNADAVEMEGVAVLQVAAKNGIPAVVIRTLSDNANVDYDELSADVFSLTKYAEVSSKIALEVVRIINEELIVSNE